MVFFLIFVHPNFLFFKQQSNLLVCYVLATFAVTRSHVVRSKGMMPSLSGAVVGLEVVLNAEK